MTVEYPSGMRASGCHRRLRLLERSDVLPDVDEILNHLTNVVTNTCH